MSAPATATRPGGVTFVIIAIWVAAAFNAVIGIWLMQAPFGQNPMVVDLQGNSMELPSYWLFMNGALSLFLAYLYVWLARIAGAGAAQAQAIIQALAVINIIFALFRLPYAWLGLLLKVLILALVSTASAKAWFSRVL